MIFLNEIQDAETLICVAEDKIIYVRSTNWGSMVYLTHGAGYLKVSNSIHDIEKKISEAKKAKNG